MNKKGCLIVFEGIEGSGKTTTSVNLQKFLISKGYKVKWTREPTRSKIGILIDDILTGQTQVAEEAIPLLFAADRADHTKRMIVPWIKKGYIVISDRYLHSSLAYQKSGMGKVFKVDWLQEINKFAINPNLIIFLDVAPEEGLSRIGKGQRIQDDKYFEDIQAQKRIRQAYHQLFNLNKPSYSLLQKVLFSTNTYPIFKEGSLNNDTTILSIDASLNQEKIQNIVTEEVQNFLKSKGIEKQEEGSLSGYSDLSSSFEVKNKIKKEDKETT